MKQAFFIIVLSIFSVSVFAGPAKRLEALAFNENNRSLPVKHQFEVKVEAEIIKASIASADETTNAYYSTEGELLVVGKEVSIDAVPTYVKRNFAKVYTNYAILNVLEIAGTGDPVYLVTAQKDKEVVILKVDRENTELFNAYKKA